MAEAAKPWWRETIETIVWAFVLAMIIRTFIVQAFWIPSGSMIPTLEVGDRVLVAKFWNWFFEPSRGSLYVFKYPMDRDRDFVKRVIAIPGDVVDIKDGIVYINGDRRTNRTLFTTTGTLSGRITSSVRCRSLCLRENTSCSATTEATLRTAGIGALRQ